MLFVLCFFMSTAYGRELVRGMTAPLLQTTAIRLCESVLAVWNLFGQGARPRLPVVAAKSQVMFSSSRANHIHFGRTEYSFSIQGTQVKTDLGTQAKSPATLAIWSTASGNFSLLQVEQQQVLSIALSVLEIASSKAVLTWRLRVCRVASTCAQNFSPFIYSKEKFSWRSNFEDLIRYSYIRVHAYTCLYTYLSLASCACIEAKHSTDQLSALMSSWPVSSALMSSWPVAQTFHAVTQVAHLHAFTI